MQIHPLVTVKKASNVLGLDKAIIRNMLDSGAIKGERRVVGNKEKWFLYQGEVQDLLERRIPELVEQAERTTLNGLNDFFEPAAEVEANRILDDSNVVQIEDESVVNLVGGRSVVKPSRRKSAVNEVGGESVGEPIVNVNDLQSTEHESVLVTEVGDHELDNPDRMHLQIEQQSIDQILHSLTIEFAHRLCEERQIICNLQTELAEKDRLLQSLPDLNQKLDHDKAVLQTKEDEITTLRANLNALEADLTWWKKPWWNRMFAGAVKG